MIIALGTADVVRCKSKKAASDSSPVLHATRPSVPKWMRRHILCEDDSEGCYPCRSDTQSCVRSINWLCSVLSVDNDFGGHIKDICIDHNISYD